MKAVVYKQTGEFQLEDRPVPELLDEELPQQLLASAFRKYSK